MAIAAAFVAGGMIWVAGLMANIDRSDASRYDQTRHDLRTLRIAVEAGALMAGGAANTDVQTALGGLLPGQWHDLSADPATASALGLTSRAVRDAWGRGVFAWIVTAHPNPDDCRFFLLSTAGGSPPTTNDPNAGLTPPSIRLCGHPGNA